MKAPRTRVAVVCSSCGWRGRRTCGDCCCYDEWAMSCRCAWGSCPKCNHKMQTASTLRLHRKAAKLMEDATP